MVPTTLMFPPCRADQCDTQEGQGLEANGLALVVVGLTLPSFLNAS